MKLKVKIYKVVLGLGQFINFNHKQKLKNQFVKIKTVRFKVSLFFITVYLNIIIILTIYLSFYNIRL